MKLINNEKQNDLTAPNTACLMWSSDSGCGDGKDHACWWWASDSCGTGKDTAGCSWGSKDTASV